MIVLLWNVKDDSFQPCEENDDILALEVQYLSAIGALMHLTINTRPDIALVVNLLAR